MKKIFSGVLVLMMALPMVLRAEEIPIGAADAAIKTENEKGSGDDYKLHAGDRIMVKIYPEDTYIHGGEVQLSPDGNITLPLIGKVKVVDKTTLEAARVIQVILDRDYLVDPEVVVEIMTYKEQSFVILGQVNKPGTYQIPVGSTEVTFLQAISLAGGFSDVANIKKVKIIRTENGQKKIIRVNAEAIISGKEEDQELKPGDVVHVSESMF